MSILWIIISTLGAIGCLIMTFHTLRKKRLVDDVPTSKTQGVFIGLSELKGTVESDVPLTSYLAGVRCVYYIWQIDEQWSRTVAETYTDSKGHAQTRTRTETGWNRVDGGKQSIPFYLKDDTGIIRVIPDGANIKGNTVMNKTCTPADPLYFGKGPATRIPNSTQRRRFSETVLPLHAALYVIGQARERQDVVAAEIARDKNAAMFLISTRTEKQISSHFQLWLWFWLIFGLIIAIGGAIGWEMVGKSSAVLDWQSPAVAVGVFFAVLLPGWVWTVYNSLVHLRNMLEQGWSQVDVQLKRRYDLIPNLENLVKGYRAHESVTQQLLAELRSQAEATPPGVAGADFKGISPVLRAVVEQYPDLKASESFLRLQKELADTEQRIALARDYFNNVATFYNTRLEIIPDRFVATLAGMKPRVLMSASEFERAPVTIKLAA